MGHGVTMENWVFVTKKDFYSSFPFFIFFSGQQSRTGVGGGAED